MFGIISGHGSRILGPRPLLLAQVLGSLPDRSRLWGFAPLFGARSRLRSRLWGLAPDFGARSRLRSRLWGLAPDFGASLPTSLPTLALHPGLGGLANDLGFVGAWWSKFELFYIFWDQTTTFRWSLEFTTRVQPYPSNRKPTHFGCVSLHIFTSQANGSAYLFLCMLFVCSAGRCQRSGAFCCRRHCSYAAR